jgi:hypothetical protein
MKKMMILVALLLLPAVALAQVATSTAGAGLTEDPGELLSLLSRAFADKDWMMVAGGLLMLVIAVGNLLGLRKLVPKKYTHWLAGGIAMASSVAVGLMAHASWWAIVSTGVGVGITAIGGWQLVLEPIVKWLRRKLGGDQPPEPPK